MSNIPATDPLVAEFDSKEDFLNISDSHFKKEKKKETNAIISVVFTWTTGARGL